MEQKVIHLKTYYVWGRLYENGYRLELSLSSVPPADGYYLVGRARGHNIQQGWDDFLSLHGLLLPMSKKVVPKESPQEARALPGM